MSNIRQTLQHTVIRFWKMSQVYRAQQWNAEKRLIQKLWMHLPRMHKIAISMLVIGAGVSVILASILVPSFVDALIGARGIGVAVGGLRKIIAALLIGSAVVGAAQTYGAMFDGDARSMIARMMWRSAMVSGLAWMMINGWYMYSMIMLMFVFVQSSTQSRMLLITTCVLQYVVIVRIVLQAMNDTVARALTVGEGVGVVCWGMIMMMLLIKNQYVINNLVMKK